ncbi:SGNH hydrolase domain-containing protein [Ottowia caeni]|uniref:SGNH hydrolase domain-containing protein n=1 Tax=Ottowia caeni TaxID=2870339 RepID=UPI003D73FCC6
MFLRLGQKRIGSLATTRRSAAALSEYQLRPIPDMPVDVPGTLARAAQLGRPLDMGMPVSVYHQRHALVLTRQEKASQDCSAQVRDPLPHLCKNGACTAANIAVPRYYDDNHLSEAGNRNLVPLFKRVVEVRPS